jgi:hypothetical protein
LISSKENQDPSDSPRNQSSIKVNLYDIRSLDYGLEDVQVFRYAKGRQAERKATNSFPPKISFSDPRHERDSLLWVAYASQHRKVFPLLCTPLPICPRHLRPILSCTDYRNLSILMLLFQLMMRPKARIRIKTTHRNLLSKREKSLSSRLRRSEQMNCLEKSKATNSSKPWQPVRSSLLRRDLGS